MDYQNNMSNNTEYLKSNAYHDIHSGMVLGIVGAAICWLPIGSIVAIVLGIIGIVKTNRGIRVYASMGEQAPGKRIAARILTICALVGGILMTIYWVFIVFFIGFLFDNADTYLDNADRYYRHSYYR